MEGNASGEPLSFRLDPPVGVAGQLLLAALHLGPHTACRGNTILFYSAPGLKFAHELIFWLLIEQRNIKLPISHMYTWPDDDCVCVCVF